MHVEVKENTLFLSNAITMNTLNGNGYDAFCHLLTDNIDNINLSKVTQADSACLVLLIDVLSKKKLAQKIVFTDIPQSLAMLSELYEVSEWIKS